MFSDVFYIPQSKTVGTSDLNIGRSIHDSHLAKIPAWKQQSWSLLSYWRSPARTTMGENQSIRYWVAMIFASNTLKIKTIKNWFSLRFFFFFANGTEKRSVNIRFANKYIVLNYTFILYSIETTSSDNIWAFSGFVYNITMSFWPVIQTKKSYIITKCTMDTFYFQARKACK